MLSFFNAETSFQMTSLGTKSGGQMFSIIYFLKIDAK